MYDLIIIGAGTSGLTAAISAKMQKPDMRIVILEKQNKCGRKLSASGNGKCNITNALFDKDCYHSSDRAFITSFLNNHSNDEVIHFFDKCGIPIYEDNGYYYPLSNQAKQVTSKLVDMCERLEVEIITDSEVKSVTHSGVDDIKYSDNKEFDDNLQSNEKSEGYYVHTDYNRYIGKNVIIAAGSNAFQKLGGSNSGYKIAGGLNLSITSIYPGLSPIYVEDDKLSIAKGVRLNGSATLHINDFTAKENGRIQINEDNLSGIAMMNLSCFLHEFGPEEYSDSLWIDVMPSFSWNQLKDYINLQCQRNENETVEYMLEGFLPSAFVKYILLRLSLKADIRLGTLSDRQINRITSNIKKLTFTPVLQSDYDKAQVTIGGVSIDEVNPDTFECIKYPGLYVVGELLDMAGKCGGYNISFAVLSGISAVENIVSKYNSL